MNWPGKGRGLPIPLDGPKYLVTTGPYLFMANPMQVSGILLTIAVLLSTFHWINFLYLVDVVLVVWLVFERMEAQELNRMYGMSFKNYLGIGSFMENCSCSRKT